jgi:hypothetical protein
MGVSPISAALTDLYDEVLEFTDECAFLCDAYAALAVQNDGFDNHTASGISMSAHVLKQKAATIQQRVREVHDLAQIQDSRGRE